MRPRLVVLLALLAAASAVAGSAVAPTAAGACSTGTVAKTASYQMALVLGPSQEMYMPSEVQARKLKTGPGDARRRDGDDRQRARRHADLRPRRFTSARRAAPSLRSSSRRSPSRPPAGSRRSRSR